MVQQIKNNQFVISTANGVYFQSYTSVVCKIENSNKVVLSYYWDYSKTTAKYLYRFLRENGFCINNKKDVLAKIKSGEFVEIEQKSIKIE